ncbi:MAG: competence/damage-inducible protein A [Tidjanibacter sp.]|nr:competence/damage-inducible protein A [Tidjanibacter sp.]
MKADIITIGDEILIGQIVDTNSAWISARLNEVGITVRRKITVGDTAAEIGSSLEESLQQADAVILTGGLGPTKDDITKLTLAEMFGSRLVRNNEVFAHVKEMMARRGIDFNELNRSQALVPECCSVLTNHNGTAPGMWFEREGKVVVSLPGVPFEMETLMREEVLPRLKEHFALRSVVHRTAITFGLAESVLAATIEPWESALPPYLHLAYLPSPSQIRLRLSAYDVDAAEAEREIDARFAALEKLIPAYVVGYGDDTVQSAVARLLSGRGLTLSVAESCTGGALSAKFTALSGASDYFMGSVVSYSNDVKMTVLGVDPNTLSTVGAVSRECAEQMAAGVRRLCGTDYAIATTGIAGPTGGSAEKPVGTVWIAISTPSGMFSKLMEYGRLRAQNIERASATAINFLRLILIGQEGVTVNQGVL